MSWSSLISISNPLSPSLTLNRSSHSEFAPLLCLNVGVRAPGSVQNLTIRDKRRSSEIIADENKFPVVLSSGKGCKLYDVEGREYLDLTSGIAVKALAHGDPDRMGGVTQQDNVLTHVSNVTYSVPQRFAGLHSNRLCPESRSWNTPIHKLQHNLFGVEILLLCLWSLFKGKAVYIARPRSFCNPCMRSVMMRVSSCVCRGIMWFGPNQLPLAFNVYPESALSAINFSDHGSTFAGNPVVCSAGIVILDQISSPAVLAAVSEKGHYFNNLLKRKLGQNPRVSTRFWAHYRVIARCIRFTIGRGLP